MERMASAQQTLDYEGILVYSLGDRIETLHLTHRIEKGQVDERVVALSGPVRTAIRDPDHVTCTLASGHPIALTRGAGQSVLQGRTLSQADLDGHYVAEIAGVARIAGRETDVLAIRPSDDLRYGYRFYLDRETGLPLKSDLLDSRGEPIEQLLFASLTLGPASPSSAPATEAQIPSANAIESASEVEPESEWRFEPRPTGYQLAMHSRLNSADGAPVEHFMFSDRLSSYSIYIESGSGEVVRGVVRMGAAHAGGRQFGEYRVTAVGEVPAATVEAALAGVQRGDPNRP